MVRDILPLGGVAAVLLAASVAVGQTPQLVVEPPRPTARLAPQPQTAEPPISKPPATKPAASEPVVIEEDASDFYPPVLMSPPPPVESGRRHRRKHANSQSTAPQGSLPSAPGPYGQEEFVDGLVPSPYAPLPPASGRKHRWGRTPPNNGAGQPGPYGYGEFADGYAYTPVGPPPPPNGTGQKNRWKHGNPDLSYYPIPGADMMDDGLNAFTDPNCLKKKHHRLHGLFHKTPAAKTAAPLPPLAPQPFLEDGSIDSID
jgi:hypothetical protein